MPAKIINRRTFLKNSFACTGLALAVLPPGCSSSKTDPDNLSVITGAEKSRVVVAHSDDVRSGAGQVDAAKVKKLLDRAMEHLFQVDSAGKAWRKLVQPNDVVGLKPNCLAGKGISTHPELVEAVIDGLTQADVPARNIIIWERLNDDLVRAGYKISYNKNSVRCYGNDYAGYDQELYEYGRIGSLLTRTVTQQCSVLINMPILKDHGIVGFSGALKNYFGAIHNPNKYHDSVGDPYVADVNCLSPLRSKTRLTICDALTAQCEGGPPFMPQWSWALNSVMVAVDPVALDRLGWQIIEDKRRELGLGSLAQVGREPRYIFSAADPQHRLGTSDFAQMDWIKC